MERIQWIQATGGNAPGPRTFTAPLERGTLVFAETERGAGLVYVPERILVAGHSPDQREDPVKERPLADGPDFMSSPVKTGPDKPIGVAAESESVGEIGRFDIEVDPLDPGVIEEPNN
jgi:hypothetical protein